MKNSELRAITDRLAGAFERMRSNVGFIADRDNQELRDRLYFVDELLEDFDEIRPVIMKVKEDIEREIKEEDSFEVIVR